MVGGKAWYTLFAHVPNFPDIPVIQTRKVHVYASASPPGRPGNEATHTHPSTLHMYYMYVNTPPDQKAIGNDGDYEE